MTFLWPIAFVALAAVPLLIVARWWIERRHRPAAVRFSSLSLVRAAAPGSSRLRRHLPFALFLIGLAAAAVAMARPAAIVSVPTGRSTVVLAIDVSGSMCATDIEPNRLLAAEAAAKSFVERQGSGTQIGVVAFGGFAEIVQVPTNDDEVLLDVISSLATGRRTAVGSAILESIDAIAEIDPSVPRSTGGDGGSGFQDPTATEPPAVPKGAYKPAIIVLLTDGASNAGPLPLDAAAQAATRGIRVYTIGFGTDDPGPRPPRCGSQFIGREPDNGFGGFGGGAFGGGGFGGGGFGGFGGGFRRAIDEDTLKAIADTTGGQYYTAQSAGQLDEVFAKLPTETIVEHQVVELSVAFTALAAAFVGAALFLGQRWRPLP